MRNSTAPRINSHSVLVVIVAAGMASQALAQDLFGVHWDTGAVYRVSTANATPVLVGNTGIPHLAGFEGGSDGFIYSFSAGEGDMPMFFRLDPGNGFAATAIGQLGGELIFEGALAFSPDGRAFAASHIGEKNPQLVTVNLGTGEATVIGTISGGSHDINGLAWRSDGMLVGIDRITNSLLAIDPQTAASSVIALIDDTVVGAVGGMTVIGQTGYFSTSGPALPSPGSNSLFSFDLFTGQHSLIGSFSPSIVGGGISGLAVPEPASLALLLVGAAAIMGRWRSAKS